MEFSVRIHVINVEYSVRVLVIKVESSVRIHVINVEIISILPQAGSDDGLW